MTALTLSQLNLFPVKSMRGIAVARWPVGPRGLRMDRDLVVVDAGGTFVSQREQPRMALLATALEGDQLVIRAPDGPPLHIPLGAWSGFPTRLTARSTSASPAPATRSGSPTASASCSPPRPPSPTSKGVSGGRWRWPASVPTWSSPVLA
ncbi:MAG TPA: MOSC N-terminal beta barrel domain-containing protein [Kofleriaceae bacterium]|nr:MOSC N-terminal beta barrel domain-containing protein [Kofleriaceae bacterium]